MDLDRELSRRSLLRTAAVLGGAATVAGALPAGAASLARPLLADGVTVPGLGLHPDSILNLAAKESPVDTIVVLMMENRSVDHHLGWLATDPDFLEQGRRRYGRKFFFDGDTSQSFRNAAGKVERTYYLPGDPDEPNPYRRCGDHPDPGHGWESGRVQRDRGFVAKGSGSDEFALGYYAANDVPLYAQLARRFTSFDRYHCSLLASTYPNRAYLHSAQSGGIKNNDVPVDRGGYDWETIWDRLTGAGVPAAYFHTDLPVTALWGPRLHPLTRPMDEYFALAAAGALPNVVFLDPGFTTDLQTDDHPAGSDTRAAQQFVADVFGALASSPQWGRSAFFITYDEWGGFFDHVKPPLLADDRASRNDLANFGQAGFRVPTLMASPYAPRGFVDHNRYDHTSILRFIEWRFLGAPATGPGGSGWWLTARDRNANNIGASLITTPDPQVSVGLPTVPVSSVDCSSGPRVTPARHPYEVDYDNGIFERLGWRRALPSSIPTL